MFSFSDLSRETYPKRVQKANYTQAYLLKAPTYNAVPAPIFTWQSRKTTSQGKDEYLNISYDKDLLLTLQGHLLFPSIRFKDDDIYRVLVSHITSDRKYADFARIELAVDTGQGRIQQRIFLLSCE